MTRWLVLSIRGGERIVVVWLGAVLVALPWLAFLRVRIGGLAALAIATLAAPTLVLAVQLLAYATGTSLVAMLIGVLASALVIGVALWLRDRSSQHGRDEPFSRLLLSSSVGAIVALGTFVGARFNSGSPRVSWAMLGDSASQLIRARLILSDGGLSAPPPFSVPLTPAIVATVTAPGRNQTQPGELLSHDLTAYATTWAALIVVVCLLAGVLGYAIVRRFLRLSPTKGHLIIAATSILPLGWFWTGYPVKFGFINAHVALILLLASFVGYLGTLKRPVLGLVIQVLAVVLVLLTWSPLAVLPGALVVVQVLEVRHSLTRIPRTRRIVAIVAASLGFVCVACLVVDMLPDVRASLSVPGGLAEFPTLMLPAIAAVAVTLSLVVRRTTIPGKPGVIALPVASIVGLAAVLALSGNLSGPWSYYPHKFAWIASAFLLALIFPLAACVVAGLASVSVRRALYGALTVILAVSLGCGSWWLPGKGELLRDNLPSLLLVEDNLPDEGQSPDSVADAVIARVGLPRLTVPWESSIANDYRAAFWLVLLRREEAWLAGDTETATELMTLAHFHESPADLCTLANLVPEGLTVETADETLSSRIEALCPDADLIVEGDPLPR